MKKLDVNFRDDKPVFDWSAYQEPKPWCHQPPQRLTVRETAVAGIVGLSLFIVGLAFIILAFLAL